MEDYVSVAGERMAYLCQQITSLENAKKLIKDVELLYYSSRKTMFILRRFDELQEKKRLQFTVKMDQLGLRRLDVAQTLTNALQHIEKRVGIFLIKPIFTETKSFGLHAQTKIFPLCRPLPVRKSSYLSNSSTLHPSVELVKKLFLSRKNKRNSLGEFNS